MASLVLLVGIALVEGTVALHLEASILIAEIGDGMVLSALLTVVRPDVAGGAGGPESDPRQANLEASGKARVAIGAGIPSVEKIGLADLPIAVDYAGIYIDVAAFVPDFETFAISC